MSPAIRVTVWNEGRHEKTHPEVQKIYPDGMHTVIAGFLQQAGFETRTATFDEPEHGLTEAVLAETDVLTWWTDSTPIAHKASVARWMTRIRRIRSSSPRSVSSAGRTAAASSMSRESPWDTMTAPPSSGNRRMS